MAYTACHFGENYTQVDGTSYACVVCIALSELEKMTHASDESADWHSRLLKLREETRSVPTNMIGGDLNTFLQNTSDGKQKFLQGLELARARIQSFPRDIPNEYLREVIGQGEEIGYIQDIDYGREPFMHAVNELKKLLSD